MELTPLYVTYARRGQFRLKFLHPETGRQVEEILQAGQQKKVFVGSKDAIDRIIMQYANLGMVNHEQARLNGAALFYQVGNPTDLESINQAIEKNEEAAMQVSEDQDKLMVANIGQFNDIQQAAEQNNAPLDTKGRKRAVTVTVSPLDRAGTTDGDATILEFKG